MRLRTQVNQPVNPQNFWGKSDLGTQVAGMAMEAPLVSLACQRKALSQ